LPRNAGLCMLYLAISTTFWMPLTNQRIDIRLTSLSILRLIFSGTSSRNCAYVNHLRSTKRTRTHSQWLHFAN
jgi:hypothetical protein